MVVTKISGFLARNMIEILLESHKWSPQIIDMLFTVKFNALECEGLLNNTLCCSWSHYFPDDAR